MRITGNAKARSLTGRKEETMTNEEAKKTWLKEATNEDLLRQLCSLNRTNSYGCNDEDLKLTKNEILSRMNERGNHE